MYMCVFSAPLSVCVSVAEAQERAVLAHLMRTQRMTRAFSNMIEAANEYVRLYMDPKRPKLDKSAADDITVPRRIVVAALIIAATYALFQLIEMKRRRRFVHRVAQRLAEKMQKCNNLKCRYPTYPSHAVINQLEQLNHNNGQNVNENASNEHINGEGESEREFVQVETSAAGAPGV